VIELGSGFNALLRGKRQFELLGTAEEEKPFADTGVGFVSWLNDGE